MKIGIDISQLAYPGTGVATYTENLVKNLLLIDKSNDYLLFFSSLRKDPPQLGNIKRLKLPPLVLEYLWNKFHTLEIEKLVGKLDLLHTSDWLEPPAKCPKVTTIHDLAVYKFPETFNIKGGHDIVENIKRKLEWVKKESQVVIAVSENTKKDIVEILGIPEEKIKVIYEAADEIYKPSSKDKIEEIKTQYQIKKNFILSVGTREPRKNLIKVIESYQNLVEKGVELELVICGNYGWGENLDDLKLKIPNLKLLGYVPKEDLISLYSGAEAFVYPSLYEGFGLPVLEAMSCGCPVVTSNISSLPEIAGSAAVLVDPNKTEDIEEAIVKVIKDKNGYSKKSLNQAGKFSWKKTAEQTLDIYKEILC